MANLWDTIMTLNIDNDTGIVEEPGGEPEPQQATQNTPKDQRQKTTIRYNPALDVLLLREVLATNPFADVEIWPKITKQFNSAMLQTRGANAVAVNDRSIKERMDKLLKLFKKGQMESLRRSGTAEEYTERDQLLQEITSLKEEAAVANTNTTRQKAHQEKDLVAAGLEIRKRAMESLSNDKKTPKKRRSSQMMEDYADMKLKEMEVRKEELKLQRDKFENEKEERMHRMEQEKEKDKQFFQLMAGLIDQMKK